MKRILPVIVISQFFCTSLWFAGNGVINDIIRQFQLPPSYLAHLTSAVQLGFIVGTLVFAVMGIADRHPSPKVFFISAIIAAAVNVSVCIEGIGAAVLISSRFLVGFLLAGIYPVGMKIVADHYREGLGRSLGFLLGALVLGTALPHLLKDFAGMFPWQYAILSTSALSVLGGSAVVLLVPAVSCRQQPSAFRFGAFAEGFRIKRFRAAAFGYFGHMWELYTFWVFVPVILSAYSGRHPALDINISLVSFLIIAMGAPACVISGLLAKTWGAKKVAAVALFTSFFCCVISPLILSVSAPVLFFSFMFTWGMSVIADSPMFSTLIATYAPPGSKGASLTIVTSIGFAITIISIQFVSGMAASIDSRYLYLLLAPGPMLGLIALLRKRDSLAMK